MLLPLPSVPYFLSKNRLTDRCQDWMVENVRGLYYLPFYLGPLSKDTNEMNYISPMRKQSLANSQSRRSWITA